MHIQPLESIQEPSRYNSMAHVAVGAIYGLLLGTSFVLMWAFIDILLHPELPLGVDWGLFAIRWAWVGVGLGVVGGLASLFNETWPSLMAGSVTASLLALLSALVISSVGAGMKAIVLIFMLVPMAVIALPITWILRRLGDGHEQTLEQRSSLVRIGFLALIAIALGLGGGYLTKMPRRAALAVRLLNDNLQAAPENQQRPLSELPGLGEHANVSYELFQQASTQSTEGFDVRAEYEDGYALECVVVVYPGSNPYISDCRVLGH